MPHPCWAGGGRQEVLQALLARFPTRLTVPAKLTDRKPSKVTPRALALHCVTCIMLTFPCAIPPPTHNSTPLQLAHTGREGIC